MSSRANWPTIVRYVALIAGGLLMVIPFWWMLVTSIKPPGAVLVVPPELFPRQPTLESYQRVFDTVPIGRMFFNSTVMTVVSVT